MSFFRHTFFTSLASAVIGGVSAAYGLLIIHFYGERPLITDAFFLAYAVYMLAMTFCVTLRVSVVPLMPKHTSNGSLSFSVAVLFLVISLGIALLSYPLGRILAYGLPPEGRLLTSRLLLCFAPVTFLLGMSFFYSGVLGAFRKFEFVGSMMVVSSLAGLILFVLTHGIGIYSVVLGFFLFNGLLVLAQGLKVRSLGLHTHLSPTLARSNKPEIDQGEGKLQRGHYVSPVSFSKMREALTPILRASTVYIAMHLAYLISQSLSSSLPQGAPTVLAYGYMLLMMTVSVTAGSIGIALAPHFTEQARGENRAFMAFVVSRVTTSNLVTCGCTGILVILAYPIGLFVFSVLPGGGSEPGSDRAWLFAKVFWSLAPGAWGLGLFSVLAPAAIAAKGTRFFGHFAVAALFLHLFVSLILRKWLGMVGLGVALSLTMVVFGGFFSIIMSRRPGGLMAGQVLARWMLPVLLMGGGAAILAWAIVCAFGHWFVPS